MESKKPWRQLECLRNAQNVWLEDAMNGNPIAEFSLELGLDKAEAIGTRLVERDNVHDVLVAALQEAIQTVAFYDAEDLRIPRWQAALRLAKAGLSQPR